MTQATLVVELRGFSFEELQDLKYEVNGLQIKPAEDDEEFTGDKYYEPGIITAVLILGPQVIAALTYIALKRRRGRRFEYKKVTNATGKTEERLIITESDSEPPSKEQINAIKQALTGNPDVAKKLLKSAGMEHDIDEDNNAENKQDGQ